MTVDPRLLRTFVAVVRLGSFSAAARELGYTQSAISQQIVALESDLGASLLTRRPVSPTQAGERLLEHAGAILLRLDAARADLARLAVRPDTPLALAADPLAVSAAVGHAVSEVAHRHSGTEVTMLTLDPAEVAQSVAVGDVDLGLVSGIAVRSDPLRLPGISSLATTLLREEDLVVPVRRDHPLADSNGLPLGSLVDSLWLDAPYLVGPVDDLCVTLGVPTLRLSLRYHGLDVRTLLELLASVQGVMLLPRSALGGRPDLVGIPVSPPHLVHRVEAVRARAASDVVQALVTALTGQPEVCAVSG